MAADIFSAFYLISALFFQLLSGKTLSERWVRDIQRCKVRGILSKQGSDNVVLLNSMSNKTTTR
jgi:multidrug resistance efflux pump